MFCSKHQAPPLPDRAVTHQISEPLFDEAGGVLTDDGFPLFDESPGTGAVTRVAALDSPTPCAPPPLFFAPSAP